MKLEELWYVVYCDKFLEKRFWHVLSGFMFVRKELPNICGFGFANKT